MTSVPTTKAIPRNVIYGLYLAESPTEEVRYVGLTINGEGFRLQQHFYKSRNPAHRTAVLNWIRKHGEDAVRVKVLEEAGTPEDLPDLERKWITRLGTLTKDGGLNISEGGDGCFGYRHDEETRARMSEKAKARPVNWDSVRAMQAAPRATLSQEQRDAISKRNRNRVFSPEIRARMSAGRSGVVMSPETHARRAREMVERGTAALTPEDVRGIVKLLREGLPQKEIGARYGVGFSMVSAIKLGKTWTKVTGFTREDHL